MISIECACGESIDCDENVTLLNEDYSPIAVTCPECGAKFALCIHMEFVEEGKKAEEEK